MKGVIYARYSSDNQREESIEGQIRECKEYAEKNGITILRTYIDRAISAKTDNRKAFQKMISDSDKNMFDVVLVWKLDRFARNRYDSARYKNRLKNNGVKLISAKENIASGSAGILLESLLEGFAEYYSQDLAEKVIRGMTENALKHKYNGGTLPIGYIIDEDQNFQIDPLTAPVVLEAFMSYNDGKTIKEIVDDLKQKGVRTNKNGEISINSLTRMLHNRKYIGEYKYSDIIIHNGIPAIITTELFNSVQEKLAKNKKAPARHKAEDDYILTTKLFCGKCGSRMVGESGTSHANKVVHKYYKCVGVKKHSGCDKKTVKKDWIEDIVIKVIMKIIFNDTIIKHIAKELIKISKEESSILPLLKKELSEVENGINNVLNAIQQGIFTPSTKKRLDELEKQKENLEIQILQEEMSKPVITEEKVFDWFSHLRNMDSTKENRAKLVDIFINSIYLFDDKIIFTFNYKDGTQTITLDEINSADFGSDITSLAAPYEAYEKDVCTEKPDKIVFKA